MDHSSSTTSTCALLRDNDSASTRLRGAGDDEWQLGTYVPRTPPLPADAFDASMWSWHSRPVTPRPILGTPPSNKRVAVFSAVRAAA